MVWIFIVIFSAIVIVAIVFAIKRREEVFEGKVIDKNEVETMNNNMSMNNSITIINRGSGNVQHSYTIKIGDTVSKAKGTTINRYLSFKIGNRYSSKQSSGY